MYCARACVHVLVWNCHAILDLGFIGDCFRVVLFEKNTANALASPWDIVSDRKTRHKYKHTSRYHYLSLDRCISSVSFKLWKKLHDTNYFLIGWDNAVIHVRNRPTLLFHRFWQKLNYIVVLNKNYFLFYFRH